MPVDFVSVRRHVVRRNRGRRDVEVGLQSGVWLHGNSAGGSVHGG